MTQVIALIQFILLLTVSILWYKMLKSVKETNKHQTTFLNQSGEILSVIPEILKDLKKQRLVLDALAKSHPSPLVQVIISLGLSKDYRSTQQLVFEALETIVKNIKNIFEQTHNIVGLKMIEDIETMLSVADKDQPDEHLELILREISKIMSDHIQGAQRNDFTG